MAPLVVTRTLHINAKPPVVWAALTEPHLIAEWFSDVAEIDLRVGGEGSLTWDAYGRFRFVVEEIDEPKTFAYRWPRDPDADPLASPSTLVRFTLEDADGGTRLTVVETGWEVFADEAEKFMSDNTAGWRDELDELTDFLEKQDSV